MVSEKNIDFKAERQKHNFGNKPARSRSSAIWCWNPEVEELKEWNKKSRNLLRMYGAHRSLTDTDRLYMKSVGNCVRIKLESLMRYLTQSKEFLLVSVRKRGSI